MRILEIQEPSLQLATLVTAFNKELAELNNRQWLHIEEDILEETKAYFSFDRVVFGIFESDGLIGYVVLKQNQGVYWLDWMYVMETYRGTNCASELFDYAEAYVLGKGLEKLYIWVHPDNQRMLAFLKKKGYDGLNLIEVTKKHITKGHQLELFGSQLKY